MKPIVKNYKPEIITCPICGNKLSYSYAISAKTISFSGGKHFFVRNLAYKCKLCNNQTYVSATASKFALTGCRYSMKVLFIIYYYKCQKYSREQICDLLADNDIIISERNVDILYKKFLAYLNKDYLLELDKHYNDMLIKFKQIRLSIDLVSYNKRRLVIIRDNFSQEIIGFYVFDSINDPKLKETLGHFLNKNLLITHIISIRKDDTFIPLLKELAPIKTKFSVFLKI